MRRLFTVLQNPRDSGTEQAERHLVPAFPAREGACHWLLDPRWGPEWKPNKAKFVLYAENNTLSIHPDPSAAEPWRREPYYSALRAQAANALQRGAMVLIAERGHTKIFLPDGVTDLGVVTPDQRIVVEQRHEGGRVVYAPRVTSDEEAKALGGATTGRKEKPR
jgi:hypothetical protein